MKYPLVIAAVCVAIMLVQLAMTLQTTEEAVAQLEQVANE